MASSDDFDDGLDFDTQVEVTIDKKNCPHVIYVWLRYCSEEKMASSDDFDDGLDFDTQVEVTIDKKNNPHVIGLRLRNIRNFGLQITGIKRDGAVFAWNCENPSRRVREYDCIVDVNGTWGDPVGMFKLIQRETVIRMVIRRTGSIEQQLRLQYRELGPEDYDLLVALDARAPTLTN